MLTRGFVLLYIFPLGDTYSEIYLEAFVSKSDPNCLVLAEFCLSNGYIHGSNYLLLKHFGEVALWFLLFFFSSNAKRWLPLLITRNRINVLY